MVSAMHGSSMQVGFTDPVRHSQAVFRSLLDAMSHPGLVKPFPLELTPPPPLHPATAGLLLALADYETPLWLDPAVESADAAAYLRFHTGARIVTEAQAATFAVVLSPTRLPALDGFAGGTPEYPDRSATVLVQVEALRPGGIALAGPGIATRAHLDPLPAIPNLANILRANHARFPLGNDLVFVGPTSFAAIPRSTRVLEE